MKRFLTLHLLAGALALLVALTLANIALFAWQFWLAFPHCFWAAMFAVTALWGADLARRLWDDVRELLS